MIAPQFAHAHNLFYSNFLPVLNIDRIPQMSKGANDVVPTGKR